MAFGYRDGEVLLSEDCGHSADLPEARDILFSCLLGNGNVRFAVRRGIHRRGAGQGRGRQNNPGCPRGSSTVGTLINATAGMLL